MMKILSVIVTLFIALSSLGADRDIQELKKLHKNHEVKEYRVWNNWKDKPITKRILPAPENIIEYIGLDNKIYGYEGVPKPAAFNREFQKDFTAALEELPLAVKKQIEKNLIGISLKYKGKEITSYKDPFSAKVMEKKRVYFEKLMDM